MLLMGKHILEKGEFPIFYYGQDWFGSLSAFVHAAVFLVLGGIPPWSIHVAPLLFFLGFCLVLYLLTRATLGPAVALVALGWNIVTPVPLSEYTVMPHGGYVEGLMLGTVLLWLSVRLVLAGNPGRKPVTMPCWDSRAGSGGGPVPSWSTRSWPRPPTSVLRERLSGRLEGRRPVAAGVLHWRRPVLLLLRRRSLLERSEHGWRVRAAQCPEGLYLLFVERLPQYLGWDLFQAATPAHALARRARLRLGSGLLPLASPRVIQRAASPEGCRHLPDLLPRLHSPARRQHPYPTKCSSVCRFRSLPSFPVAIGFWLWFIRAAPGGSRPGRVAPRSFCFMDG